MCEVKKFQSMYKEISELQPEDTLQLVLESGSEDEKMFFEMVGDFLLQQSQKKSIKEKIF